MKAFAATLLAALILISSGAFARAEEQPVNPKNGWLNGKWSGQPPAGGVLQMTLVAAGDNRIKGQGLIHLGGGRGAHPQITGTVAGNRVRLRAFFPSAFPQSAVVYLCKLTEGALQCRTPKGYETTFKKIEKDVELSSR